MALTALWWKGIKKVDGKVDGKKAPATGLGSLLTKYETARLNLTKAETTKNCDAASLALKAVDENRKKWSPKVKDEFPALAGKLNDMTHAISVAQGEIKTIVDNLGLEAKMDKAGSEAEKVYEALWQTFENQRDTLATGKSRILFTSALATLDKLHTQAGVVGDSDIYLKLKYDKLAKGIAGIKVTTLQQQKTYVDSIDDCITARKDLLEVLKSPGPMLQQAITQVKGLKQKALDFQAKAQAEDLTKVKKAVSMIVRGAATKVDEITQAFAPGTKVRESLDVKAAKMHKDDAVNDIVPLSSQLFTVNKSNLAEKKELLALAQEIALIV